MTNKIKSFTKKKINKYYFSLESFTPENLNHFINENFKLGINYSILICIRYDDGLYGMTSTQVGFKLDQKDNKPLLNKIYKDLFDTIEKFSSRYVEDSIDVIEF